MEAYEAQRTLRQYILEHSIKLTPEQAALREITKKHERSIMTSSIDTVQLLHNLIFATDAKKVLDIGVFTGISAVSEALAMSDDGRVIACDVSEEYANIGRPYWEKAGVAHKIILKIGNASDTLDKLIAAGEAGTFDFAFIDADKVNYLKYYEKCLVLVRPKGIIAFDNLLWRGSVAEPSYSDGGRVEALREVNNFLKDDERVKFSLIHIGDGLGLACKR